jgi:hypothetical protein
MLQNPLYAGRVSHKGKVYDGQHPAIIDQVTWDRVQAHLAGKGREHQVKGRARQPSLLADLLVDEHGTKLTCTHAVKDGKRYRYYVRAARPEEGRAKAWRLPAASVEALVLEEVRGFLEDEHRLAAAVMPWAASPDQLDEVFAAGKRFLGRLADATPLVRNGLLALIQRVWVREHELVVTLRTPALVTSPTAPEQSTIELRVTAKLPRDRLSRRIVRPADSRPGADAALIKVIARGYVWFDALATGQVRTVTEIARCEGVTDRYVSCLIKLAFLSPRIVEQVLAGRRPPILSTKKLAVDTSLSLLWRGQEADLFALT